MRTLNTILLAAVLTACGDATAPEGIWQMTTLNGSELPYDHTIGCCIYGGATIEFTGTGFTASITFRNHNNLTQSYTETSAGTWTPTGDRVAFTEMTWSLQPFLLDTATISGNTLTVAFGGEGHGSPDQFHAVFVR